MVYNELDHKDEFTFVDNERNRQMLYRSGFSKSAIRGAWIKLNFDGCVYLRDITGQILDQNLDKTAEIEWVSTFMKGN